MTCLFYNLVGKPPGRQVVSPTVLPTAGSRTPTKKLGLGALRPTVGDTVGETAPFPGDFAIKPTGLDRTVGHEANPVAAVALKPLVETCFEKTKKSAIEAVSAPQVNRTKTQNSKTQNSKTQSI